jgi:hypothetical protein
VRIPAVIATSALRRQERKCKYRHFHLLLLSPSTVPHCLYCSFSIPHHSLLCVRSLTLQCTHSPASVAMAELSLHGKHQAKRLEPSPLRNEVRAESVVEERRLERSPIRAPDSQYVIRETQLEHHQDNESDYGDPLSPSSAALLDRTAVKKSIEMTEPSSLLFTPLLKESILTLSSSAPATSVGFTFGQPKKANSKIPPRPEAPVTQPETKASAAVHSGDGGKCLSPYP